MEGAEFTVYIMEVIDMIEMTNKELLTISVVGTILCPIVSAPLISLAWISTGVEKMKTATDSIGARDFGEEIWSNIYDGLNRSGIN